MPAPRTRVPRLGGAAENYALLVSAPRTSYARSHGRTRADWPRDRSSLRRSAADRSVSHRGAQSRSSLSALFQAPTAGLDALDDIATLSADSALAGYRLLHSVRGDLLMKMGRFREAREEVQHAIDMTQNLREQELLTERLKQIEKAASPV